MGAFDTPAQGMARAKSAADVMTPAAVGDSANAALQARIYQKGSTLAQRAYQAQAAAYPAQASAYGQR